MNLKVTSLKLNALKHFVDVSVDILLTIVTPVNISFVELFNILVQSHLKINSSRRGYWFSGLKLVS